MIKYELLYTQPTSCDDVGNITHTLEIPPEKEGASHTSLARTAAGVKHRQPTNSIYLTGTAALLSGTIGGACDIEECFDQRSCASNPTSAGEVVAAGFCGWVLGQGNVWDAEASGTAAGTRFERHGDKDISDQ